MLGTWTLWVQVVQKACQMPKSHSQPGAAERLLRGRIWTRAIRVLSTRATWTPKVCKIILPFGLLLDVFGYCFTFFWGGEGGEGRGGRRGLTVDLASTGAQSCEGSRVSRAASGVFYLPLGSRQRTGWESVPSGLKASSSRRWLRRSLLS